MKWFACLLLSILIWGCCPKQLHLKTSAADVEKLDLVCGPPGEIIRSVNGKVVYHEVREGGLPAALKPLCK